MRHELHLARVGFTALAVVAVAGGMAGVAVDGRPGAVSALLGVAIVGANHGLAVLSTAWARVMTVRVLTVGYSIFLLRMLLVFGIFAGLTSVDWIHGGLLAAFFCAALVASLTAECLSYARGSYVPVWMRRPSLVLDTATGLSKETR